jgi:hypothetical protein
MRAGCAGTICPTGVAVNGLRLTTLCRIGTTYPSSIHIWVPPSRPEGEAPDDVIVGAYHDSSLSLTAAELPTCKNDSLLFGPFVKSRKCER